jgi:saccharopine dehydrogenase (NAD+, L-lysine forming)
VEVAHVEHEEVVHVGYFEHLLKGVKKATFKYALGDEFIQAMEVFKSVNLHSLKPVNVRGVADIRPRDLVEAAAPDPNEIGKRYVGQSCAGTWVRGRKDGREREIYLYQVVDNQDCVDLYGTQGVVAQTAFPGVIALELLATDKLAGHKGNPEAGVFPAQAFTCDDFVSLQKEYGFPGGVLEMDSEYKRELDHAGFVAPVEDAGRAS